VDETKYKKIKKGESEWQGRKVEHFEWVPIEKAEDSDHDHQKGWEHHNSASNFHYYAKMHVDMPGSPGYDKDKKKHHIKMMHYHDDMASAHTRSARDEGISINKRKGKKWATYTVKDKEEPSKKHKTDKSL